MMRNPWTFVAAMALIACGDGDAEKGGTDGADDMNAAYNDELDGLLAGFESWPQVEVGLVESDAVHGEYVENWLNDAAKAVVDAQMGESMPDGAILVKQGYGDAEGTDVKNLTVMWKTEGEWFWAQYDNAGALKKSGFQLEGCVECHEGDAGAQDGGVIFYDW